MPETNIMELYAYIWKALKDGRPVSSTQLFTIAALGVFGLGFNYIFPSHDHEIYDYWPKLGVALSFIITILCLLAIPMGKRQDWSVHQTRLSLCLMFCTCCIRQCEENIIDCMLREGAFIPSSNKMLDAWLPGFHCDDELNCVFSKYNTMAYNTAGLWPLYMLMPFFFQTTPLYAVCACGVAIVSSLGHVVASVVMLAYSPGCVSALLLVCPAAMYSGYLICTNNFAGHPSVYVAAMAAGAICHVGVGITFFLVKMLGYLPEVFFPFFMYGIFSMELGLVCRLFGGPTEKFIAQKKLERDSKRYKTLQGHLEDLHAEEERNHSHDERSFLL